ncbi:MAG: helix-turn-helix domain-containing protein [Candidatus Omnitrophica bacterium]|nr:helix-turn-helix domain-containing protein [Candidatus Omnitrophota bacterium]
MNTKEVAQDLKLHIFTVHRYACEGKIPAFKIDGDWKFYRRYIERWIKQKIHYLEIKENKKIFDI